MNLTTIYLPTPLELMIDLSDEQFFDLCQKNRDFKFERTASRVLVIMSPTGGETSNRNIELSYQLQAWSRQNQLGKAFDSSGGFKLPNGADRSPDASWVQRERWESLSLEQREKFLPLCPDFVVELRSASDRLKSLQDKMQEYRENGAKLGWLIDPQNKRVEIYRPDQEEVEIQENPTTLSGENVLPGFILDLTVIW
ncbi:MAG: Uma2 family endonuclease [Limnoraphis sp. WC205]|jgi:Uma2 family endonuclease|nr:Uma2 family endonuclease [Limnoraphis sp. WC205]